jgi:hypothetical protein
MSVSEYVGLPYLLFDIAAFVILIIICRFCEGK